MHYHTYLHLVVNGEYPRAFAWRYQDEVLEPQTCLGYSIYGVSEPNSVGAWIYNELEKLNGWHSKWENIEISFFICRHVLPTVMAAPLPDDFRLDVDYLHEYWNIINDAEKVAHALILEDLNGISSRNRKRRNSLYTDR